MNFREILKKIGTSINSIVPKNKHKILFESNSDYCDNSRFVYDYMQLNHENEFAEYEYVWCVKNPKEFDKSAFANGGANTKITSFHMRKYALNYLFHLFTSKTVIYTHFVPPFCSAKSQTVVNLWHGTPLKEIKGHCHKSELFSYLLSPSEFVNDWLIDSFMMEKSEEKKLIVCGYPRNDILFKPRLIFKSLNIDKEDYKKAILWMPTFRKPVGGDYQDAKASLTGIPLIDTVEKLIELNEQLINLNLLLIIKLHPGQDLSGIKLTDLSNIKMLTNKELSAQNIQVYELVSNCDVLLTDYSSIYFDYLLLNRPIGFIIDDIDEYTKNRGFVVENPLLVMPGEKIKTKEQLYDFLSDTANDKDEFEADRLRVNDMVNKYKDGNSTKRLLDVIL